MSAADHGETDRAMLTLQAKLSEVVASQARLEARVVALEESAGPSPEVDPAMPSRAERDAMRERLRARTLAGIEANKADPTRAGRTFRRDVS